MHNLLTQETVKQLEAKLDMTHTRKRSQGGIQVNYLEGWYVIDQANKIFGFDGWQRETVRLDLIGEEEGVSRGGDTQWRVGYRATVRVNVRGVVREGSGFGDGRSKSRIEAHELALKEAETDAMKRAFSTFGNIFGLALYDKSRENVETLEDKQKREKEEAFKTKASNWVTTVVKSTQSIADLDELRAMKARTQKSNNFEAIGKILPGLLNEVEAAFKRKEAKLKTANSKIKITPEAVAATTVPEWANNA